MAIFKKILFLSLTSLFLLTCKKDDSDLVCTDANTIRSPQEALDYFYFKKGTWWLYQEDSTGLTDSIWVSEDLRNSDNLASLKYHCGCGYGKCVENIIITLENRIHNSSNGTFLIKMGPTSSLTLGNADIGEYSDFYFLASGRRLKYQNYHHTQQTDNGAVIEDIDSLNVKGQVFKNLVHLYYPNQNNIPDWLHEAWYAKNIYLVKYRRFDGTNWSLIDYHIVK